jgi:hypothetical protein
MVTGPDSRLIHDWTFLWIFVAALAGVGVGAGLFGNRAAEINVTAQSAKTETEVRHSVPGRVPHVVLDTQIVSKAPNEIRNHRAHRFAVFNSGTAPLLLREGSMSNGMRVESCPAELAPGGLGYVAIAWSPLDSDRSRPWVGRIEMMTNDPQNKRFDFVIAEDAATDEE